ncbi:MAG: putative immunity protein [Halobacteriota archaeon]
MVIVENLYVDNYPMMPMFARRSPRKHLLVRVSHQPVGAWQRLQRQFYSKYRRILIFIGMKKPKLAVSNKDNVIAELVRKTDNKTLTVWACDCAKRALPYFEAKYSHDNRPRLAIEAGRAWVKNGSFRMADIRKIALAAHAAARDVKDDNAARSAARAAGHALATAHVPSHAVAAAIYAATSSRDAVEPANAEEATDKEREWQLQHLLTLSES